MSCNVLYGSLIFTRTKHMKIWLENLYIFNKKTKEMKMDNIIFFC